jgi:hypothetical protein
LAVAVSREGLEVGSHHAGDAANGGGSLKLIHRATSLAKVLGFAFAAVDKAMSASEQGSPRTDMLRLLGRAQRDIVGAAWR